MKKGLFIIVCSLLAWACSDSDESRRHYAEVPDGMVAVRFALPGMLSAEPRIASRAGSEKHVPDEELLKDKTPQPLAEGSTLWLLIEGKTEDKPGEEYRNLKSYVVKGAGDNQALYPCKVDTEGMVTDENVSPLYLPFGTYSFRALSPAKAFVDENGDLVEDLADVTQFYRKVSNGETLISNDERYRQTLKKEQALSSDDDKVQVIRLNPLINQTARFKFTLYADPEDLYIHRLEMLPAGVEISGLQDMYGENKLWSWSPELQDTLVAYPGKKHEALIVAGNDPLRVTQRDAKEIVIETGVLPTDATSSSVIVLFNMKVNGIPTQYEMMLNQKILRAAFSYHYKGKVTITNGISAITWQNVSWSTDVEIDMD